MYTALTLSSVSSVSFCSMHQIASERKCYFWSSKFIEGVYDENNNKFLLGCEYKFVSPWNRFHEKNITYQTPGMGMSTEVFILDVSIHWTTIQAAAFVYFLITACTLDYICFHWQIAASHFRPSPLYSTSLCAILLTTLKFIIYCIILCIYILYSIWQ